MDNWCIIALELAKAILVPSALLIIILLVGALLLWSRWHHLGRWLTTVASVTLFVLALLPISTWVARPLETRFPPIENVPDSVAGIILLGGAFQVDLSSDWGHPQVNSHAERL